MHHQPTSTLFPYTTLFRSMITTPPQLWLTSATPPSALARRLSPALTKPPTRAATAPPARRRLLCMTPSRQRSEEHTSELQSLRHLVCRLLLEKKKNINTIN